MQEVTRETRVCKPQELGTDSPLREKLNNFTVKDRNASRSTEVSSVKSVRAYVNDNFIAILKWNTPERVKHKLFGTGAVHCLYAIGVEHGCVNSVFAVASHPRLSPWEDALKVAIEVFNDLLTEQHVDSVTVIFQKVGHAESVGHHSVVSLHRKTKYVFFELWCAT